MPPHVARFNPWGGSISAASVERAGRGDGRRALEYRPARSLDARGTDLIPPRRRGREAARDALADGARLLFDESIVEREQAALAHDDAPLDDDRAHVPGLRRVDEVRVDVVARRLVQRVEADDDE